MRSLYLSLLLLSAHAYAVGVSQGQVDDFQTLTTQSWANGGSNPLTFSTGGPAGAGDAFIRNHSTGSGGGGHQVMFNTTQWVGDWGAAEVGRIALDVRNNDASPRSLRLAMKDSAATTQISSTQAVSIPADGSWHHVTLSARPWDFSLSTVTGAAAVLGDVGMLRILSSTVPSFSGDLIVSDLDYDNITALNSDPLYMVPNNNNIIYKVDPFNDNVLDSISVSDPDGGTYVTLFGLAKQPGTGQIFTAVRYGNGSSNRRLAKLDLQTGSLTLVGSTFQAVVGLAFDNGGQLYALSGQDINPEHMLFKVNSSTGAMTNFSSLSPGRGHGLAYDTDDGFMYHIAGDSSQIFEKIDLSTGAVTPIALSGDTVGQVSALYYLANGNFGLVDLNGGHYLLSSAGLVTALGTSLPGNIKGVLSAADLIFMTPTPTQVPTDSPTPTITDTPAAPPTPTPTFTPYAAHLYGIETSASGVVIDDIDPSNGSVLNRYTVHTSGLGLSIDECQGLTFDPASGYFYALASGNNRSARNLLRFSLTSLSAVNLGLVSDTFNGLAVDGQGRLLASAGNGGLHPGDLYQLDMSTAAATRLGSMASNGNVEMAYAPDSGLFYAAIGNSFNQLRSTGLPSLNWSDITLDLSSASPSSVRGLAWDPANGSLVLADNNNNLFNVSPAGVVSDIGSLNYYIKGIVFAPAFSLPTPSQTPTALPTPSGKVLYAVDKSNPILYQIDLVTGSILDQMSFSLPGQVINNVTGMALQAGSGRAFFMLQVDGQTGRELVSLDPSLGSASLVDLGNTGRYFAGLAFDPASGKLYGVDGNKGNGGGIYQLNTITAGTTFIANDGPSACGLALAWDSSASALLRAVSSDCDHVDGMSSLQPPSTVFSALNLDNPGDTTEECTAMTEYVPGVMLVGVDSSDVFTFRESSGFYQKQVTLPFSPKGLYVAAPMAFPTLTPTPTDTPSPSSTVSSTQTLTLTPSPSSTVSATFSFSPTFTPSATPTVTPTAAGPELTLTSIALSQTPTPTFTPTPAFARTDLDVIAVLGPMPIRRGQPLRLFFVTQPTDSGVDIYNLVGEKTLGAVFGSDPNPSIETTKLAPGIYYARIKVDGRERWQKVVLVP